MCIVDLPSSWIFLTMAKRGNKRLQATKCSSKETFEIKIKRITCPSNIRGKPISTSTHLRVCAIMALRKAEEARPNKSITASEPRPQGGRGPLCTVLPQYHIRWTLEKLQPSWLSVRATNSCSARRPYLELEIATNVPIPNDGQQDVDWVTQCRRAGDFSYQPRT
jgi:hypothetical protein